MRPDVAVEPPDVGVVYPDAIGHLGRPVLAVDREQPRRLEGPMAREGAGVLRDAVERRRYTRPLHPLEEGQHPLPVARGVRHERHDQGLGRLGLDQRVPVEHGPHHGQVVALGVGVASKTKAHHVSHLVDVVRGHHEDAARGLLAVF